LPNNFFVKDLFLLFDDNELFDCDTLDIAYWITSNVPVTRARAPRYCFCSVLSSSNVLVTHAPVFDTLLSAKWDQPFLSNLYCGEASYLEGLRLLSLFY
jgi:hypothetical protein